VLTVSLAPVSECPVCVLRSPSRLNAQLAQYGPPLMPSPTAAPLLLAGSELQLSVAVHA
jgi:hypothetical protein